MKSSLLVLFLVMSGMSAAFADAVLLRDNFTRPVWRVINTKNFAKISKRTLLLEDDKPYFRSFPGAHLFGSKMKLEVTNTENTPYKLGLVLYGKKMSKHFSKELSGKGEFIFELPENVRSLGILIIGKGKYQKLTLTRIFDPDYTLAAYPGYQMYQNKMEPVTFNLYHKGKLVENAEITENGMAAVHRPSGAVVRAYADKADTSKFDAAAKQIKISKKHTILYLGDSLTHYDMGFNHVSKLEYFLNKFNPDKVEIFNYACGGDDIIRIVDRFSGKARGKYKDRYYDLAVRKYDTAFIFLGHNDTKASSASNYKIPVVPPAKQKIYYERLIAKLKTLGVKKVVLVSSTSSNEALCSRVKSLKRKHNMFGIPEHQINFNKVLKELARSHSYRYFDLYTPMAKMAAEDKAALLNPRDGVHLSPAGHNFVALKTLEFLGDSRILD